MYTFSVHNILIGRPGTLFTCVLKQTRVQPFNKGAKSLFYANKKEYTQRTYSHIYIWIHITPRYDYFFSSSRFRDICLSYIQPRAINEKHKETKTNHQHGGFQPRRFPLPKKKFNPADVPKIFDKQDIFIYLVIATTAIVSSELHF